MSKSTQVQAAGTVVLDGGKVLLVHRPRYDDWSFPKGKVEGTEILPVTAARECDEETGYATALGPYLGTDHYPIPEGEKIVHYWAARVREEIGFAPDEEVDQISWLTFAQARKKLTYSQDCEFLDQATQLPETSPLIILRHAKAMKRSDFNGTKDSLRPLSGRGRRQSKILVDALDSYGIEKLISSPYVRCRETLQRYAKYLDTKIEVSDSLSESGHELKPKETAAQVAEALLDPTPTVVCSHRPVITTITEALASRGIDHPLWDHKLSPAAFFVIHRKFNPDGSVTFVNIEQHDVPGN